MLLALSIASQGYQSVASSTVLSIPDALTAFRGPAATTQHEFVSLEGTFGPAFAVCFHTSEGFRNDLIGCASDVGSLFSRRTPSADTTPAYDEEACRSRLGNVLRFHLGANAPTAEDFVSVFSKLCGDDFCWGSFTSFETSRTESSYHCKVLPIGAVDWHQDWAAAEMAHMFDASRTVMFAFPAAGACDHDGSGILTELIQLTHEFSTESLKTRTSSYSGLSTDEADRKAAMDLGVSDHHIVRPRFGRDQEILRYKDAEYLHRSPRSSTDPAGRANVCARTAIWRFQ